MQHSNLKKHIFILTLTSILSIIYFIPNLYQDQPTIVLTRMSEDAQQIDQASEYFLDKLESNTPNKTIINGNQIYLTYSSVEEQMQAKSIIESQLPDQYNLGLNLLSSLPNWLQWIGAEPMRLGLDLRGGVHLLLNIDLESTPQNESINQHKSILSSLRQDKIAYQSAQPNDTGLILNFNNSEDMANSLSFLKSHFPNHQYQPNTTQKSIHIELKNDQVKTDFLMTKTLESIKKRVNELGLSEALVQREGQHHISVDIPGIQDIEKAKAILGNTATLSFHLVAKNNDSNSMQSSQEYPDDNGSLYKVENQSILSGDAITFASANVYQGRPIIQIQLGGGGEERFHQKTANNIGKQLAILYSERKHDPATGERVLIEKIISAPLIKQALRGSFIIEGIKSFDEASTLALLLRAGSLAAPVEIAEQSIVGPSLGAKNIEQGVISMLVGLGTIMTFMILYYRVFGIIANIGLILNLLLTICILSFLEATLTLPAMAAMVLSVGMAVDANVLIYERIREELRLGKSKKDSILLGYDKAFITILDASATTFIVSAVLYCFSTGIIQGFAITLMIGLIVSMFTSVYITRVLTSLVENRLTNLAPAIGI